MYKIAIAGFRHNHIMELVGKSRRSEELELVGCAESDDAVRAAVSEKSQLDIAWSDPFKMIDELEFDILGIGDVYGRRGALTIAALKAGKHVLADKPLCTSLEELAEIRRLTAEKNLSVSLMLPLWYADNAVAARKQIENDAIGEIQSVIFTGVHPLNYGTRPDWYWTPALHGGTLNDLVVHGIDTVEFLTGCKFAKVTAARCWNSNFSEQPDFKNGAHFMAELDNGAGVMGDVSYFAPCGGTPDYWRFSLWGTKGYMEFNLITPGVTLVQKDNTAVRQIFPAAPDSDYLKEFLKEISGTKPERFNTEHILNISEFSLKLQAAADK